MKKLILLVLMLFLAACNNDSNEVTSAADPVTEPAALPAGITLIDELLGAIGLELDRLN